MDKALLCDIDGTLVDSNALHAESWRRSFENFGIEVSLDETWQQIGKGGDQLIPVFVKGDGRVGIEKEIEQFRKDIFHRDYMPKVSSFARSRDLLVRVRQSGRKIVLATSSSPEDIAKYKRIVQMDDLVEEEATSADAQQSKPSPDIFAAALEKAGLSNSAAIALGDTPYDAHAAAALDIKTIGLTCGGWKRGDLIAAGCVEVYKDPADLLIHFESSILSR